MKDLNGKMFNSEMTEIAKKRAKAGLLICGQNQTKQRRRPKWPLFLRVPGQEIMVGAGIYE